MITRRNPMAGMFLEEVSSREWTILAVGDSIAGGGITFHNYRAPLAERTGLKPDDVVIRAASKAIETLDDLQRVAGRQGAPVRVTVVRE